MRKRISWILIFVFVAMMALAGCSSEGKSSNLVLATGGTSGTYYSYGGSLAELWNSNIEGMNITAQSTGASTENLRLIAKGEADFAIVQNDVMDYAYNGIETFEGKPLSGFSAVCTLYPEVVQIVARPGTGIETIADLKGKTVSVGAAGSGVEANAAQILKAYGLTFKDINLRNLGFSESSAAFQDNQIDAFFITAGLPNAAIQEICATKKINLISIEGEKLDQILDEYGYYTAFTIPGGTYAGQDSDVTALSIRATLIAADSIDAKTVNSLCEVLFDNLDTFSQMHAKGKELSLQSALQGISIPMHPGAQAYFEEKHVPQIVVSDVDTGDVIFTKAVFPGDIFKVSYIHSVNNSPVTDFFKVTDDYEIMVYKTQFLTYGAGIPEPEEGTNQVITVTDDYIEISNINRVIEDGYGFFVGTTAEHTLYFPGEDPMRLKDVVPEQTHIVVDIE